MKEKQEKSQVETIRMEDSSPTSHDKRAPEPVDPDNANSNGNGILEPETPVGLDKDVAKDVRTSKRKSSLKAVDVGDNVSPKTPIIKDAKPAKTPKSDSSSAMKIAVTSPAEGNEKVDAETPSNDVKAKRGRPMRNSEVSPAIENVDESAEAATPTDTKLKRGRPKKNIVETSINDSVENADNVEVNTDDVPARTKGAQKRKKMSATPVSAGGDGIGSPNEDLTKSTSVIAKKRKLTTSVNKSALDDLVDEEDSAVITPSMSMTGDSKIRGRKKSVGVGGTEEPLFTDDRLPAGWSRILIQRQGGATAGKYDVYILSPWKKRFRSRNELKNYIVEKSLDLEADSFDFSVCGKELKSGDLDSPLQTTTPTAAVKKAKVTAPVKVIKEAPTKKAKEATTIKSVNEEPAAKSVNEEPPAKRGVKRKREAPKVIQKDIPAKKVRVKKHAVKKDSSMNISDSDDSVSSPYFSSPASSGRDLEPVTRIKPLIGPLKWTPPRSPYNLIQENLFHNPWQLLVATILLNKSLVLDNDITGKTATPIIYGFFKQWPTPEAVENANTKDIAKMIKPLGLHDKRAHTIKRFSDEFRLQEWIYPKELYGIGKYGNDSYKMFCINEWRTVNPSDTMLIMYKNWMVTNWRELCKNTNNCLRLAVD